MFAAKMLERKISCLCYILSFTQLFDDSPGIIAKKLYTDYYIDICWAVCLHW